MYLVATFNKANDQRIVGAYRHNSFGNLSHGRVQRSIDVEGALRMFVNQRRRLDILSLNARHTIKQVLDDHILLQAQRQLIGTLPSSSFIVQRIA